MAQVRPSSQTRYPVSFFSTIFGGKPDRASLKPLYGAVVTLGRDPAWYRAGGVPDTLDGRFDMIAAILSLVLLRMEREGERAAAASVELTEIFIDDMDGTVRQIGIGDLMVGKHVGRMVGALGGRLAAFRPAIEEGSGFEAAVRRNVFHDAPPPGEALRFVTARLERFQAALGDTPLDQILAGDIAQP